MVGRDMIVDVFAAARQVQTRTAEMRTGFADDCRGVIADEAPAEVDDGVFEGAVAAQSDLQPTH